MKKVIIFSFLALSCTLMSCTADAIPQAAATVNAADDIGGQNGQVPVPPPPPTKP